MHVDSLQKHTNEACFVIAFSAEGNLHSVPEVLAGWVTSMKNLNPNFLDLKFLLAASLLLFCAASADASSYQELNREGIEALKSGELEKAEKLFKKALDAYVPEKTRFDLSIKNNLNVLYQKMKASGQSPEISQAAKPLEIRFSDTNDNRSILEFAQKYFDREASIRMQEISKPALSTKAKIERRAGDKILVHYRGPARGKDSLEIEAEIIKMAENSYKLLSIKSTIFHPLDTQYEQNLSYGESGSDLAKRSDDKQSQSKSLMQARSLLQDLFSSSAESNTQFANASPTPYVQTFPTQIEQDPGSYYPPEPVQPASGGG